MSDNLEKRLERASNEQSGHNMVAVVKGGNNRRIYMIEYNIPEIIGFITSSLREYETICNTKLPFEEILNEVGKKLGITEDLLYYLLDDKSRKYIFEQLNQPVKGSLPKYISSNFVLYSLSKYISSNFVLYFLPRGLKYIF